MLQNLQNFEIVISKGYASVRYESLGTSYFVSFLSRIFGEGDQVVVTRHEYTRRATVADFANVRLQYLHDSLVQGRSNQRVETGKRRRV
jgi:hypothetical protein